MGMTQSKSIVNTTKEIDDTLDKLRLAEKGFLERGNQYLIIAKQHQNKDKPRFIQALRMRENCNKRREQILAMQTRLVSVKDGIAIGEINRMVITTMKDSLATMRSLSKGQNVNDIETMFEEFQDLEMHNQDIITAIGQPNDILTEDDSLIQEFANLENELTTETLNSIVVPTHDPKAEETRQLDAILNS